MTSVATYRHQTVLQNNYIVSMVIIPIHKVTKSAMKEKVEIRLLQVAGISRVVETHMTGVKIKWLVLTDKACKV